MFSNPFFAGKEDGKFCKKVTVRMTIRKNDCRSNTPVSEELTIQEYYSQPVTTIRVQTYCLLEIIYLQGFFFCLFQVNIVSCDGKCPSASIYNYNINTYARFCKCCRELGLHRRNVQLYCSSNSTWVSYTIQEPTDCSCQWS